jgi:hypothetical protein
MEEMAVLGLRGGGSRRTMTLGAEPGRSGCRSIVLAFPTPTTRRPAISSFNISRSSPTMPTPHGAWRATPARRRSAAAEPVKLPQSSGGVTAIKFRDPEGHPLEFLEFPAGSNPSWSGRGMMGIDHSAISRRRHRGEPALLRGHGLAEGKRTLNQGPTQVALDGLDGVEVDVLPMNPPDKPPHVELLGYRRPAGRPHAPLAANDVAATRIVWRSNRDALVRDPDGHLLQLTRKIDRQQILRRGDEQPPSVRAAERAVRGDRRGRDEAELAAIGGPDVHAVRRARPHPAARIDLKAVGIAMIGVAEKAPIGERAAFADIERDDLVLRSRRETRHLAQGQRRVRNIERARRPR